MSGIGDSGDNSDLQRIREVNQEALRRQAREQKRGHEARIERSFKEVMAEHGRERATQQAQREAAPRTAPNPRTPQGERLMDQVRARAQTTQGDLAQRAALSRTMAGNLMKGRAKGHRSDAVASDSRAEQILTQGGEELDFVHESAREEDVRDFRATEEKQAEITREARHDGPIQRDGERGQQRQQDGSSSEEQAKSTGVEATDGPRAAHKVNVPPALIQQLVRAVFKAVGPDGRTQMQIHLRGGPLDGVKLEVRAENGQVQCTFHGCDREMAGLLRQGRTALADGLSKRGLKLTDLTVA